PALEGDLAAALDAAKDRSARLHGKIGELDAAALASAVDDLQDVQERVEQAGAFAYLNFATDTSDPARGALLQKVEERATAVGTELIFFELEWAAVPDDRADELLPDPALDRWPHFLKSARRFRPHLLSQHAGKVV